MVFILKLKQNNLYYFRLPVVEKVKYLERCKLYGNSPSQTARLAIEFLNQLDFAEMTRFKGKCEYLGVKPVKVISKIIKSVLDDTLNELVMEAVREQNESGK